MLVVKNFISLAFSLFASVVFSGVAFASETPQISQHELLTALKTPNHNIVILDVRSPEEYENGHLVNAINVSHNTVAAKLDKLSQYENNTVVVYCRSGRRAAFAEQVLTKNNFRNLRHLTGDMNGWLAAKLPVVTDKSTH